MIRSATALLSVLSLLLAAPARGATPPPRRAKTDPTKAPAALAAPAPAQAVPAPARTAPAVASAAAAYRPQPFAERAWRAALLAGPAFAEGERGVKVRLDLERDVLPLGARGALSTVISAGAARWGKEETTPPMPPLPSTTVEATSFVYELVPSLRARVAVAPKLSVHVDGGLGAAYQTASVEARTEGFPAQKQSDSGAGMILRFGAGGGYDVNDRLRLGAEVLGVNFHYGDVRGRTVTVLAAVAYRL